LAEGAQVGSVLDVGARRFKRVIWPARNGLTVLLLVLRTPKPVRWLALYV